MQNKGWKLKQKCQNSRSFPIMGVGEPIETCIKVEVFDI